MSRKFWKPPKYKFVVATSSQPKEGNLTPRKGYIKEQIQPHLALTHFTSLIYQERVQFKARSRKKKSESLGEARRTKNLCFGLYLSHTCGRVLGFLVLQKDVEVICSSYRRKKCSVLYLEGRIPYLDLISLGKHCLDLGRSKEEFQLGFP